MIQITQETPGLLEDSVHKFSVEASDIGIRPGEWPKTIPTRLGNGVAFIVQRSEVRDGDLLWVDYRQGNGCLTLRVYND